MFLKVVNCLKSFLKMWQDDHSLLRETTDQETRNASHTICKKNNLLPDAGEWYCLKVDKVGARDAKLVPWPELGCSKRDREKISTCYLIFGLIFCCIWIVLDFKKILTSKLGNQLINETQHTSWHTNKNDINTCVIILLIIMNVKYKFNINVVIIQNML